MKRGQSRSSSGKIIPSRRLLLPVVVVLCWLFASLLAGFLFTFGGTHYIDDGFRMAHSLRVLQVYGLLDLPSSGGEPLSLYGALWELVLGVADRFIFFVLRDPLWVRHACNAALYLLSLPLIWRLLRRTGMERSSATLGLLGVVGIIRLGGHALFNSKDMPAAIVFLLASLCLWHLFCACQQRGMSSCRLIGIGAVAILPFLVRPPLLLHVCIAGMWLSVKSWQLKGVGLGLRLKILWLPAVTALLLLLLFYPVIWHTGDVLGTVASAATYFRADGWDWKIWVWDRLLDPVNGLPWWYPFSWIIVNTEPLLLCSVVVGWIFLLAFRRSLPASGHGDTVPVWDRVRVTFPVFLAFIAVLSWVFVVALRPALHDEDRHILFLFPHLMVAGMLGWQIAESRIRWILVVILTVASVMTYAGWRELSYVYISPLVGDTRPARFMGDYYGLCTSQAVRQLSAKLPAKTPVVIDGWMMPMALAQAQRYRSSLFLRDPSFNFPLFSEWPKSGAFAVITVVAPLRVAYFNVIMEALRTGEAVSLWKRTLPSGYDMCHLVYFPNGSRLNPDDPVMTPVDAQLIQQKKFGSRSR